MECLLQYWDDLDDLFGIVGLLAEKIRRAAIFALGTVLFFGVVTGAMVLAWYKPPIALGMLTLLIVALMYTAVTVSSTRPAEA